MGGWILGLPSHQHTRVFGLLLAHWWQNSCRLLFGRSISLFGYRAGGLQGQGTCSLGWSSRFTCHCWGLGWGWGGTRSRREDLSLSFSSETVASEPGGSNVQPTTATDLSGAVPASLSKTTREVGGPAGNEPPGQCWDLKEKLQTGWRGVATPEGRGNGRGCRLYEQCRCGLANHLCGRCLCGRGDGSRGAVHMWAGHRWAEHRWAGPRQVTLALGSLSKCFSEAEEIA